MYAICTALSVGMTIVAVIFISVYVLLYDFLSLVIYGLILSVTKNLSLFVVHSDVNVRFFHFGIEWIRPSVAFNLLAVVAEIFVILQMEQLEV
jgi:hypothetical protein